MVIASVVMPPSRCCPHVGAVGRGLPARVCYYGVRVGVGSIVPVPTLRQRASAENELKLESARPGVISNAHLFKFTGKSQVNRNHRSKIPSVNTKQQSRLKYSWSLVSISFLAH
jgi:hypothetical protein